MITEYKDSVVGREVNPVVTAALQKLGEALYLHNAIAEERDSVVESLDYLASCGVLE